jgi:hypothetical protein
MLYPKAQTKPSKKKNEFTAKIKKVEKDLANGICRKCKSKSIAHYHHITEKGLGGSRGLSIQINCLGLCCECHNHDDSDFSRWADIQLYIRIDSIFADYEDFTLEEISKRLGMTKESIDHQHYKGFLTQENPKSGYYFTKNDIKRWLRG